MSEADLKALALEFLGAFATVQGAVDRLAQYAFNTRIADGVRDTERSRVPTATEYLFSRLRLNDDDRWQLVSAVAKDLEVARPDKTLFMTLKRNRDFLAHQTVSLGDREGVEVLMASRQTPRGLEQWSATEAELQDWIRSGVRLAEEIHELGRGRLYWTVTATRSTTWNVLPAEREGSADEA